MSFDAVIPVAFFTEDNVAMTQIFLEALAKEPGLKRALIYLNGGNEWAGAGETECLMFSDKRFMVTPADGWPFYRMWNDGIRWANDICLVLNNDITWNRGALQRLAQELNQAPEEVAVTYPRIEPDNRGLAGWCFAIRREAFEKAGPIDERYGTWYGDDELALNLKQAGYTSRAVESEIWHYVTATMRHRPGYQEQIFADMRLFEERWPNVGIYGAKL